MRLFPAELEIGPDEGFMPEKDIFGRKSFGDQLTRIIQVLQGPRVLLLDAPWGSGKSTFIKMWCGELKKNGIPAIYFDAFANDYQQDAFLAVASQIIGEAEKFKPKHSKQIKKFKTKALATAKALGRASVRFGVRALTAGAVDAEDVGDTIGQGVKVLPSTTDGGTNGIICRAGCIEHYTGQAPV